jgi:hypothetical protein
MFDVGERAAVEFDHPQKVEQPFVDIEQRSMAAKATGQGAGGNPDFADSGLVIHRPAPVA